MDESDVAIEPYWEVHRGEGPYLLLLHGFLCSRAQWLHNIEALAEVTQPVIVELLGHGRSPAPETPDAYRPEGYVAAFENIRRRLGASSWLLCGQSLGAGITLRYALEHPERVIAQVFTNSTSALQETGNIDEAKKTAEAFAEKLLGEGREGFEKLPIHPIHAHQLPEDVRAALIKDCLSISPLGAANTMRYTLPGVSVRPMITRNSVPTLLVCGKKEKRFVPFKDYAKARMPLLEIVDVEAGHAVNIEAAQEFNAAVRTFVCKHAERDVLKMTLS